MKVCVVLVYDVPEDQDPWEDVAADLNDLRDMRSLAERKSALYALGCIGEAAEKVLAALPQEQ